MFSQHNSHFPPWYTRLVIQLDSEYPENRARGRSTTLPTTIPPKSRLAQNRTNHRSRFALLAVFEVSNYPLDLP